MGRFPVIGTQRRNAFASVARLCVDFSRILLIVAAIELVTMPLTQHLWTWDHFLHGGQDFESNLLIAVTFLCLVLLFALSSKHHIDQLFSFCRVRWFISRDREQAGMILSQKLLIFHLEGLKSRSLTLNCLPLQI